MKSKVDKIITDYVSGDYPQTPFNLTAIEKDILLMLSEGMDTNEIAEKRNVSSHTVANQIRVIGKKFNSKTRAQSVAMAIRNGLILSLCFVSVFSQPDFARARGQRGRTGQNVRLVRVQRIRYQRSKLA